MTQPILKAPFPAFGGKSAVAADVWRRFGDVPNFVEPFFNSGAVLLSRPGFNGTQTETANDLDGMISNFWRAVKLAPDAVAEWADWPVNENDLHARDVWLRGQREPLTARLEGDPMFYDAQAAGWWVWGACIWIGGGWCDPNTTGPWVVRDGQLVRMPGETGKTRQLLHLGNAGKGINRKLPQLRNAGEGIHRKSIVSEIGERGACAEWSEHLRAMMQALSDRLRRVRVCCGDWTRVLGPTPTIKQGLTAVFLDPPYSHAERDNALYAVEDDCSAAVREWAIANGGNRLLRIALCGYEDEHEMPRNWECFEWKARGGYASQGDGSNENQHRERIWFSPHCLQVPQTADMFAQTKGDSD